MLEIEIVESNIIKGGVEVFARAWRDGVQIGFGKDGTVDIERFRIFNPPVFVDDPNGDIEREGFIENEEGGTTLIQWKVREDPEEALLQSLEHTIGIVGKDGTNIVAGKRGNTTSTFYSATGDGQIGIGTTENQTVWANARAYTTATYTNDVAGTTNATRSDKGAGHYRIYRLSLPFDTSAIGDSDTISSATYSIYPTTYQGSCGSAVTIHTRSSTSTIASTEFDITKFGTRLHDSNVTLTINQYNNYTFNATGLAAISKTGYTIFGMHTDYDYSNNDPGSTARSYSIRSSDYSDTTYDPKLVVEHAAAGYANKVLGVASASIGKVNGVAKANISKVLGV